ncbi:hypothetical protein BGX38DRAFT_1219346, partial [Terfezia claveryi]
VVLPETARGPSKTCTNTTNLAPLRSRSFIALFTASIMATNKRKGSLPPQFHPVSAPLAALLPGDTPVSIPVKKLTFQRIVAAFGLTFSDHYLDRESHFVQIPRDGENDVLDMELINHACLGPRCASTSCTGASSLGKPKPPAALLLTKQFWRLSQLTSRMADDWRSATERPDSTLADIE